MLLGRKISATVLIGLLVASGSFHGQTPSHAQEDSPPTAARKASSQRSVLVELYTSQGCNMCPEAEAILGTLAEKYPRVVPIAFHVDYFDKPWKDPFSDKLNSQRQLAYNAIYKKPKPAEYGLYYTPMMMVDGEQSVNGRDRATADQVIRRALARKPEVALSANLDLKESGKSGTVTLEIKSLSSRVEGRELLVAAVLREDGVVTRVESGENARKTLTSRFPARATKFTFVTLDSKKPLRQTFTIEPDPSCKLDRCRLATFVQDKQTGVIYQADDQPWKPESPGARTTAKLTGESPSPSVAP